MSPDPATALVALGAGVASFFAPCILPVVPGYLAFITGGDRATRGRRLLLTGAFVAGFAVLFVVMGLLVGTVGTTPWFRAADEWVERIGGTLIIAFGLYMTGLLKIPLLDREVSFRGRLPADMGAVSGAFGLGAAFGVGWSPCVGPVLASILVVAGVQGGALQGGLLLGIYALGMAVPFLVVGVTADRGAAFLKRHRRAARWAEVAGGILLVVLGIFVFTGSIARVTSYLI